MMSTCVISIKKSALTVALLGVLMLPMQGFAQTEREVALEARVVELERQVQLLLSTQQQQEGLTQEIQAQVVEVQQKQAVLPSGPGTRVVAGDKAIQVTTITPGAAPGTTFKFGGFIKADFMGTKTGDGQLADNAGGRALYLPGLIPIGGGSSSVDYDSHAKFSRFNLGVDTVTEEGDKLGAMIEMDFFGNSLGNQMATNTYGTTVRHAFVYWNNWLAGQTWSNFMDGSVLPEAVDFVGPTDGLIFARQTQIRYTRGGFSVALENPETTVVSRTDAAVSTMAAISSSDRGALPDLTMRYGWKGDWGTFGVGALVRQLKVDNWATGYKDSKVAGGLTLGGRWQAGANDVFQYQLTGGEGISRYIGLGITGDAVLDANDGRLDSTGVVAGIVAWRHHFSSKLRSSLMYGRSDYDNDTRLTGLGVTKSVQSIRANVFYSPLPKLDLGAELMYGKRKIESGETGDLTRLQFTTKYSF